MVSKLTYKKGVVLYLPARWDKHGRPLTTKIVRKGVAYCQWCAARQIKPPRRKYCSKECSLSAQWLTRWSAVRYMVRLRDKKCQICGKALPKYVNSKHKLYHVLKKSGYDLSRPLLEIDHIVPKCEGGAHLHEDNLRLLCQLCHKVVTKELAKRRKVRNAINSR